MRQPFAEVIGDPVAQSKSPIIHKHWLDAHAIEGRYDRTRVTSDELATYLDGRRVNHPWRGCNVTIPHKERIIPLLDRVDGAAAAIGAVNCVVPEEGGLAGYNTDVDGVAAALAATKVEGVKVAVIGGGGAARAAISWLAGSGAVRISLLVRNAEKAEPLRELAPNAEVEILSFDRPDEAFADVSIIVNASPLGMAGAPKMPSAILDALVTRATGTTVFDMVTTPADTAFLEAARTGQARRTIDGLTMLIGQARRAFELFFGRPPPEDDLALRRLLLSQSLEGLLTQ
jgi:shikimate dehydrogenase